MTRDKRTNITVYIIPEPDDHLRSYRCRACDHVVFQYYGLIDRWIPGDYHSTQLTPSIMLCNQRLTTPTRFNYKCQYTYFFGPELAKLSPISYS